MKTRTGKEETRVREEQYYYESVLFSHSPRSFSIEESPKKQQRTVCSATLYYRVKARFGEFNNHSERLASHGHGSFTRCFLSILVATHLHLFCTTQAAILHSKSFAVSHNK